MEELLKPVKTVRNVRSNIEKFETLSLGEREAKKEAVSTRPTISEVSDRRSEQSSILKIGEKGEKQENGCGNEPKRAALDRSLQSSNTSEDGLRRRTSAQPVSSPEEASIILKGQPGDEELEAVLHYLGNGIEQKTDFNIQLPSPPAAQILNLLTTNIIPDRWAILDSSAASQKDKATRKLLLSCMNSTAGLGALVARVQGLVAPPPNGQPSISEHAVFKEIASFFASMVYHKTSIKDLLSQVESAGGKPGQRPALWVEAISLLAGSKVLNVFLEASTTPEFRENIPWWLQDAREYTVWLGENIASAAISVPSPDAGSWKKLADFLKRALSLGFKGSFHCHLAMLRFYDFDR